MYIILVIVLVGGLLLYRRLTGGVTSGGYIAPEGRERQLMTKVTELEHTVATLLIKLNEAQREIEALRQQLVTANVRITELEGRYVLKHKSNRLLRPLLVICGDDAEISGADLATLDGIGIRYLRLYNASPEEVANELARAREDDRLYNWVLISAHCSKDGVRLRGKMVTPDFWMRQLRDVEMVGLASCDGANLADHLFGKVDFVWYFKEKVPLDAANRFVQKFFQRINVGESFDAAFISCLDAVPEVASYADYRSKLS